MSATRTECDSFGAIQVPADRLWGAQTQRSLDHFSISTERMPDEIILALLRTGKRASYAELATNLGHDSFLLESEDLYALVRSFLGAPHPS